MDTIDMIMGSLLRWFHRALSFLPSHDAFVW
jgi:hypothetical protein